MNDTLYFIHDRNVGGAMHHDNERLVEKGERRYGDNSGNRGDAGGRGRNHGNGNDKGRNHGYGEDWNGDVRKRNGGRKGGNDDADKRGRNRNWDNNCILVDDLSLLN